MPFEPKGRGAVARENRSEGIAEAIERFPDLNSCLRLEQTPSSRFSIDDLLADWNAYRTIEQVPAWYRDDPMVACYASHLESLILDAQPALWIHGHLHNRSDYIIGQTRVLSNPRGYPGERTGFDPSFFVEIGVSPEPNEPGDA